MKEAVDFCKKNFPRTRNSWRIFQLMDLSKMFWCLDDAKGSSASKFYSRQESKKVKIYDQVWSFRIFRKKFPNWNKQKVWPKNSIISNWDLLSGNWLPVVENVLIQIFKTCNRLHKSCNLITRGDFQKIISKRHIYSNVLWTAIQMF